MFHAGTLSAAIQRIQLAHLEDEHFSPIPSYMHVYEVPVKEGAHVYDDPSSSGYTDYHVSDWDMENALNEGKNYKEVVPYTNAHEDPGSMSFFVPKKIGAQHYVGSMPFTAEPEVGNEEKVKKELGYD